MKPEDEAREKIDAKLEAAGWIVQDKKRVNLSAGPGVAVREHSTSTGPVDYTLYVDEKLAGIIEAKRDDLGKNLIGVEEQSSRYTNSDFKDTNDKPRFIYEATGEIIRFTDRFDQKCRSREVFSFFQPETLRELIKLGDKTIRNNLKTIAPFDGQKFRKCQITAIENLDRSFSENKPRALVQMATGAGKTVTAITSVYRLLKQGKFRRILFLVDTRSLGIQAEQEFQNYTPYDDNRKFNEIYGVYRLNKSSIPDKNKVYISTIQRMYSILKGEELDESAEETSMNEMSSANQMKAKEVVYNPDYPPEFFDCIIVDECHRSIYNVWSQVLTYFDAFIVGLTATPDKRTFAFFNENIVSEYSREQAITDGVNVGEDVFCITTEIGEKGAKIDRQLIEYRNRQTRARRWGAMDDDYQYLPAKLDRDVVNKSQIRTVIQAFKDSLYTKLFPGRKEVPKTLIFAKLDNHAGDIVEIVREVFNEGNDFCKKITHQTENPDSVLSSFRNEFNPRIAVTVDMIATGTDVKPIECLIFMRDVRSRTYFEQMKGRGTRTLSKDELQKVSPSAPGNKDRFIIVDAVGVTKSKKTDTRPLEYKPTIPLSELMISVAMGQKDGETLTSLANRLIRMNVQLDKKERSEFIRKTGAAPEQLAQKLLESGDDDVIANRASVSIPEDREPTKAEAARLEEARRELVREATAPFNDPDVREFIENVRRSHEQILDSVNTDTLLSAEFAEDQQINADAVLENFHQFIEKHRDEILALRILYDQNYQNRPMVLDQLMSLHDQLRADRISLGKVWESFSIKKPDKVKKGVTAQLTDLISMIRFEAGQEAMLNPFADKVNLNYQEWTFRRNSGNKHFTEEQMHWLRLIKDHIIGSLSIEEDDFSQTPFGEEGGLQRFYLLFGDDYENILKEMNTELVA